MPHAFPWIVSSGNLPSFTFCFTRVTSQWQPSSTRQVCSTQYVQTLASAEAELSRLRSTQPHLAIELPANATLRQSLSKLPEGLWAFLREIDVQQCRNFGGRWTCVDDTMQSAVRCRRQGGAGRCGRSAGVSSVCGEARAALRQVWRGWLRHLLHAPALPWPASSAAARDAFRASLVSHRTHPPQTDRPPHSHKAAALCCEPRYNTSAHHGHSIPPSLVHCAPRGKRGTRRATTGTRERERTMNS